MTITYPPGMLPSRDFDEEPRVWVGCPKCKNMALVVADQDEIHIRCAACGDVTAEVVAANR